jgi:hypothetical protein
MQRRESSGARGQPVGGGSLFLQLKAFFCDHLEEIGPLRGVLYKRGGLETKMLTTGVSIDVLLLSQVMYTGESDPTASQHPSKPVRDWILGRAANEVKRKFIFSKVLLNEGK